MEQELVLNLRSLKDIKIKRVEAVGLKYHNTENVKLYYYKYKSIMNLFVHIFAIQAK